MSSDATTGTIETAIPARLDRLPWGRFHWLVVFGRAAEEECSAGAAERRTDEARRARAAREREARIRRRIGRRQHQRPTGLGRFRPGPASGASFYSPGIVGTSGATRNDRAALDLDREVESVAQALAEHGAMSRRELARVVGARYWGPGRLSDALREARAENRIRRISRSTFAPADGAVPGEIAPARPAPARAAPASMTEGAATQP